MDIIDLPDDGELTREITRIVGNPFTVKERMSNRIFGLGHLLFLDGPDKIKSFYDDSGNAVKTHFDWTSNGAVIRMRTVTHHFALLIKMEHINSISLVKGADILRVLPFTPVWILLKLGVPISAAKWLRSRNRHFIKGPVKIEIDLGEGGKLIYSVEGNLWRSCLATFNPDRLKGKLKVEDEGSRVN